MDCGRQGEFLLLISGVPTPKGKMILAESFCFRFAEAGAFCISITVHYRIKNYTKNPAISHCRTQTYLP